MTTLAKSLPLIFISTCWWHYLRSPGVAQSVAQIIPDDSLGNESSTVTSNTVKDTIADYLEGGATRDNNLFHSFSEFNIPEATKVYFASPIGIDNIITRVTGSNLSLIEGTLGVDGSANLFLLNPNGIIFGQNSQLDIAGSFLATTAESYIFQNDFEFSATNPESPPLLTIDIPVGLQFGSAPGSIANSSTTEVMESDSSEAVEPDLSEIPEGLRVGTGHALSLIGGDINLNGGYLNSVEGRIELGAVGANNRVGIRSNVNSHGNNWQIDYQNVNELADINISEGGGIDGGNTGKTQIALTGRNISLGYDLATLTELGLQPEDFFTLEPLSSLDELPENQAQITAHNHNNQVPTRIDINASDTFSIIDPGKNENNILAHTLGTGEAGTVNLVADTIILYGASVESWTLDGATGNSGVVNFIANHLSVQYGGGGVNTFGEGQGGLIDLKIAEDITIGNGGFGAQTKYIGADEDAGAGGTVKIEAENLKIVSGGIGVDTFASGQGGLIDLKIANNLIIDSGGFGADAHASGDGGKIEIEAQNIEFLSAGLGANTWGRGAGGEIEINADTILLKDGIIGAESGQNIDERDFVADDAAVTFGGRNAGDGGSIGINAQSLLIDNGNISTSTFGIGDAGDLDLNINSVEAVGGEFVTGINSTTNGKGKGGTITLNSDRLLSLSDGATIAADSTDIGQAGDIEIDAHKLFQLENGGTISVNGGRAGLPGNITIQGEELVLNNGKISATTNQGKQGNISLTGEQLFLKNNSEIVTNAGGNATGGNIFIDLKYNLLGLDNSEITASAVQGQGGNIQISTRGIFLGKNSKISASSEFGTDGLTRIDDTLVGDPNADLIQLPTKPLDPDQHLSRGCSYNKENKFISIGRGGLPANPLTSNMPNTVLGDLEAFTQVDKPEPESSEFILPSTQLIIEAQTWKVNQDGKIELLGIQDQTFVQNQRGCLKSLNH